MSDKLIGACALFVLGCVAFAAAKNSGKKTNARNNKGFRDSSFDDFVFQTNACNNQEYFTQQQQNNCNTF